MTLPHKVDALLWAGRGADSMSRWIGAVNTLVFDGEVRAHNTDCYAAVRAIVDALGCKPAHLADYMPATSCVVLHEPDRIEAEGRQFLGRVEDVDRHHRVRDVLRQLARFPVVSSWLLAAGSEEISARLPVETVERFRGDVSQVRDLLESMGQGHDIFIVSQTEAEAERLGDIFATTRLATDGKLHFSVGQLRAGFRLVREKILVLSGAEMFSRVDLRRTARRRSGKAIDSFLDLRDGDLVVHLGHGIGRYRGLKVLEKDDQVEEHLELEFHGGTKL